MSFLCYFQPSNLTGPQELQLAAHKLLLDAAFSLAMIFGMFIAVAWFVVFEHPTRCNSG